MIKSIRLESFKCFQDTKIPLNRLNLLAGANASGKSSIIQAMLLAAGTNEMMKTVGSEQEKAVVDTRKIFGIPMGSPRALISNNSDGYGDYDFSITVNDEPEMAYQFGTEADDALNLKLFNCKKLKFHKGFPSVHYLNAERTGPRLAYEAGGEDKIDIDGGNSGYLIYRAEFLKKRLPELLCLDETTPSFQKQVEAWMSAVVGEVRLEVQVSAAKAQTEIKIQNPVSREMIVPTMTGFGISYVLPIVVAGLWCASEKNALLIVENPEAHLHPEAQSHIGKFLAYVAQSGVQVLVETHSEHVVDGARIQMAHFQSTGRMNVLFSKREEGNILVRSIGLNSLGELAEWPAGFFDQKQLDLKELFYYRRKYAGR